jgi:hypothetical protein
MRKLGLSAAVAAVTIATAAAGPAFAGEFGLATKYTVITANPEPVASGQLGWLGIANAGDLNADGKDDILVPQYSSAGAIFVVSGATGAVLRKLTFPDAATSGAGSAGNFVYPAKIADLTSCPGGVANVVCPAFGGADGVPEVLVGAPGTDIPGAAPDMGRAFVFDGATGALLRRVQMPPADLTSEATQFPAGKSFGYGRAVESPASPFPVNAPAAVKLGDIDGGGKADFSVSNPTFYEAGPATNPSCDPGPCMGSGRVYFYRGEDVATTGAPGTILDTPLRVVKNPQAESDADHERFGHATYPVGDVGKCNVDPGPGVLCTNTTSTPDGRPDVIITAHQASSPLGSAIKGGVVVLIDGLTGSILRLYSHPEPQSAALFGYAVGTMPTAIGDVAGTGNPDILVAAVGQNVGKVGAGRAYVMNGDFRAANPLLSWLDPPDPNRGQNFGAPFWGIGDVAGDAKNEVLAGNAGPWQPGDDRSYPGSLEILDAVTQDVVATIPDPEQRPGGGFGQGAIGLGDVNGDQKMDFAATAGYWAGGTTPLEGRLYILHSDTSPDAPPPPPPPPPPLPAGPAGPQGPAGAAAPAPPPAPATVQALAGRTLELAASPETVRRGARTRLRGALEAFSDEAACTRGVSVRVQRRTSSTPRYTTFTTARTNRQGDFSLRVRPSRTTFYRAVVSQTSRCMGAASAREKVSVMRPRTT